MRRTILLLATMALALLLVGGVATSKQPQDQQEGEGTSLSPPTTTLAPTNDDGGTDDAAARQSTTPAANGQEGAPQQSSTRKQGGAAPASDKGSGDVSIESSSTTPKASFISGSGANYLRVQVSDHGNLMSFESPAGQEAVATPVSEGYVLCSTGTSQVLHGHDTGSVEGGFGTPTFAQPNGAGTFPLTVTRNTTDGKFQLKQVWAKPDVVEKDVTVTMTLKNITSAPTTPFSRVILERTGDFDVGVGFNDYGAYTKESAWQWDSRETNNPAGGLMLTGLTFGSAPYAFVENHLGWNRQSCTSSPLSTPTDVRDLVMRVGYEFFNLGAGQSKTVKIRYGRM